MTIRDEGAIARRIAKAERRIARGINERRESGGVVSEAAILARLKQLQKEKTK